MEDHKSQVQDALISGALKFSTDYTSKQQIYEAVLEWVKTDTHILAAAIRGGGDEQIAVDFRYDASHLGLEKGLGSKLISLAKEFFIPKLGERSLIGWDFSSGAIVVK